MIGAVVTQRVEYLVAGDVLEDNGIEITKQDRAPIEDAIDKALKRAGGKGTRSLPPAYKEDLVEGLTRLQVLRQELGDDEFQRQMSDALTSAHVEIASHFGTWDTDRGGVVPPSGPLPAPGSQDDGSGGGSNGNSGGGSGGGSGSA